MLSIAHAATGAFIATKVANPALAIPLIIISHFVEDYIPHWDVGQGLTKKIKSHQAAFFQELFSLIFIEIHSTTILSATKRGN